MIGSGCEMTGRLKRGKIWEMKIDAPEDLLSSDVINDIVASKLKCCFLLMGVGVFSASLTGRDSKCSDAIGKIIINCKK